MKPKDQEGDREQSLIKQIASMTVGQKTKLALSGGKDARVLLSRERSETIRLLLLKNPRITEAEVAQISASKESTKEMLSQIGTNREWIRHYQIKHALVCNPKTPINLAIKLLEQLKERDIRLIGKSKNVSTAVSAGARRILHLRRKI